jgi:hypothetical protein
MERFKGRINTIDRAGQLSPAEAIKHPVRLFPSPNCEIPSIGNRNRQLVPLSQSGAGAEDPPTVASRSGSNRDTAPTTELNSPRTKVSSSTRAGSPRNMIGSRLPHSTLAMYSLNSRHQSIVPSYLQVELPSALGVRDFPKLERVSPRNARRNSMVPQNSLRSRRASEMESIRRIVKQAHSGKDQRNLNQIRLSLSMNCNELQPNDGTSDKSHVYPESNYGYAPRGLLRPLQKRLLPSSLMGTNIDAVPIHISFTTPTRNIAKGVGSIYHS